MVTLIAAAVAYRQALMGSLSSPSMRVSLTWFTRSVLHDNGQKLAAELKKLGQRNPDSVWGIFFIFWFFFLPLSLTLFPIQRQ
jgi:hypothetical protein